MNGDCTMSVLNEQFHIHEQSCATNPVTTIASITSSLSMIASIASYLSITSSVDHLHDTPVDSPDFLRASVTLPTRLINFWKSPVMLISNQGRLGLSYRAICDYPSSYCDLMSKNVGSKCISLDYNRELTKHCKCFWHFKVTFRTCCGTNVYTQFGQK